MSPTPQQSPQMAAAWAQYQKAVDTLRDETLSLALAADPEAQVAAQYLLMQAQAAAFNLVISPRSSHPVFQTHTFYDPNRYTWLLANPDFLMRVAFVDGARQFVIRGQRGRSQFLEIQALRGFWGDPDMQQLANYEIDTMEVAADGQFSVGVGPEPVPGIANWIKTDPASDKNSLLVRECFGDWSRETPSSLSIEPLDTTPASALGEADMLQRLEAAVRMMRFALNTYCGPFTEHVLKTGGLNHFFIEDTSGDDDGRSNPSALYVPTVYEIAAEEALIIELTLSAARYWSVQLGDVWLQATDWVWRQCSLNGHQTQADADGKVRLVLAARDPGVANWLDVGTHLKGVAVLRAYFVKDFAPPVTQRVSLAELDRHLPADTQWISREQRQAALAQRARSGLARYGY